MTTSTYYLEIVGAGHAAYHYKLELPWNRHDQQQNQHDESCEDQVGAKTSSLFATQLHNGGSTKELVVKALVYMMEQIVQWQKQ